MFNVKRFLLRTTLAVLALVGFTFQAQAEIANCTNIPSVPFSITASGIYCLNADLVYANISGAAIAIKASDVTLDLNGYKLRNSHNNPARTAVGIKSTNRKNITLRNGTIRGFLQGVYLKDTSALYDAYGDHLLEDLVVDSNTFIGLRIQGPDNRIRQNFIINTGGTESLVYGMLFYGPRGEIIDNKISKVFADTSSSAVGISVGRVNGGLIQNNRIIDVTSTSGRSYGINLDNTSANNNIQGNIVINSGATGTYALFNNSSSNICRDNTFLNYNSSISGFSSCTNGGGNVDGGGPIL